jgi:hypothetical protein
MFQKLFHIMLVFLLALLSVVFIAFLLTGVLSMFGPPMLSGSYGISAGAGGLSARRFNFLVLAATLLVCGVYFFLRHRGRKLR